MADTITLAMKMTFSQRDFDKAKALLSYHLLDENKSLPGDEFFTGNNIIDLNLSVLMSTSGEQAHEMCLAMMLFMVAVTQEKPKSKWQQRMEDMNAKKAT